MTGSFCIWKGCWTRRREFSRLNFQFSNKELQAGFYFEFGADKAEDKGAGANENDGNQVESGALGRDGKGKNGGADDKIDLVPGRPAGSGRKV